MNRRHSESMVMFVHTASPEHEQGTDLAKQVQFLSDLYTTAAWTRTRDTTVEMAWVKRITDSIDL